MWWRVGVLVVASLGSAGCLHTWTQTYHDYPPEAWDCLPTRSTRATPGTADRMLERLDAQRHVDYFGAAEPAFA